MSDELQTIRFEQAVLPHLAAAYNLARWLVRDVHDAEDIVQQAMLRACRGFGTFRGGDAQAWVLAIVRNACYTHLRSNRRADQSSNDALDEQASAPGDLHVDPQAILLQRLDADAMAAAIEALPAPYREVIVLREIEDLPYARIAEVANVPIGTVMSRLSRARQRLAQSLSGQMSNGM